MGKRKRGSAYALRLAMRWSFAFIASVSCFRIVFCEETTVIKGNAYTQRRRAINAQSVIARALTYLILEHLILIFQLLRL